MNRQNIIIESWVDMGYSFTKHNEQTSHKIHKNKTIHIILFPIVLDITIILSGMLSHEAWPRGKKTWPWPRGSWPRWSWPHGSWPWPEEVRPRGQLPGYKMQI